MESFPVEILEKYKLELEIDTRIDELNIKEAQLKLPGIKHKWVARLIQAKTDLRKLTIARTTAVERLKAQVNAPIELTEEQKGSAAGKQSVIKKIDYEIIQQELIIDYLTRVEVIMKSLTYDLSNLISIMKMESM